MSASVSRQRDAADGARDGGAVWACGIAVGEGGLGGGGWRGGGVSGEWGWRGGGGGGTTTNHDLPI